MSAIRPCKICSSEAHYNFYGVQACEGCKQFFRRVILRQLKYTCPKNQNCDIVAGERCPGCRLSKCLLSGMDVEKVNFKLAEDNAKAKEFKKQLALLIPTKRVEEPIITSISQKKFSELLQLYNSMAPLENAYRRCWESTRQLPREYVERHENIVALLVDNCSLQEMAHFYAIPEPTWDKAQFLQNALRSGLFSMNYVKIISKDCILAVEIAKAMPHFQKLNTNDQVALLKQILSPLGTLCGSFYSFLRGHNTVTRGNGMAPICILEAKGHEWHQNIQALYARANCVTIERISETGIGQEEFVLLMAIILSNSNGENLSASGRELLYAESVRYSQALQQLLVAKFGHISGAQKLAQLMRILETAFRVTELYRMVVINVELFHERKHFKQMCPKVLMSLFDFKITDD